MYCFCTACHQGNSLAFRAVELSIPRVIADVHQHRASTTQEPHLELVIANIAPDAEHGACKQARSVPVYRLLQVPWSWYHY